MPGEAYSRDFSVAFVSHGFGYGDDLMYFGEIFRALRERFARLYVCVESKQSFRNPYRLDLRPAFRMIALPVARQTDDGERYDTEVRIVSPALLARLLKARPGVIVTIEFTTAAMLGTIAARMLPGCGHVVLIESDPSRRGGSRNKWVLRAKRWFARQAHVVQTNDEDGFRYITEELRV
ncbi:glycosyltransferase [Croceicoccus sp. YJ47]|uniref:glycosyltransferase n=1 Tax=Croceicoccus sp. YJ47 TaxID=2798724 RepID=UPI0019234233|nr:glycosyltransferase [Croceicoccus sp. YJ47]QQN72990.1 hypothetical protein JD971_08760 [Croceicoccus sp. YJ47]